MSEPIIVGAGGRRGNRRVKVLGGVAAGILVVSQLLPRLLGGGGDDTTTDAFTPVPTTAPGITTDGDAPRETFETFSSKNPFTPLVNLTPASDEVTTVAPPEEILPADGTIILPDPGTGDGTTSGAEGEGGETSATTAPPPPIRQPDRVSLLEVYSDQSSRPVASVRVNDTTYQVARGDEFATSYRIVSLDTRNRCAQLLFGDDLFTLCEGEEVRK